MAESFKFKELDNIVELVEHIESTYSKDNHYIGVDGDDIQLVEFWNAKGTAITTCGDIAEKYLTRFGKKKGYNKSDLYKAIHNILFMLYFAEKNGLFEKPVTDYSGIFNNPPPQRSILSPGVLWPPSIIDPNTYTTASEVIGGVKGEIKQ
jgi:hypothetical protein